VLPRSNSMLRCVVPVEGVGAGPEKPLGKPGKCPGPRAFGGLAREYQNQKTPLLVFHVFRLFAQELEGQT